MYLGRSCSKRPQYQKPTMHIVSREIPYKLFLFRGGMTLAILQKK